MPLTARLRTSGEVVCILDYASPRPELPADELVCPFCAGPLIVRHGLIRARHFAHLPGHRCPYETWHEPESPEHCAFKAAVRDYLRSEPLWQGGDVHLEVRVEQARRIADVLVTFASGWRVAHECQVSAITMKELAARTKAYQDAGIDVVWWFESGRLRAQGRWLPGWLLRHQGAILEADIRLEVGERETLWE